MWFHITKSFELLMLLPMAYCSQYASYLSLKHGLTLLDQSFDKDISKRGPCDLLLMTHVEEDERGDRGTYTLSSANLQDAKEYFRISNTHCLILVASGKLEMEQLLQHGKNIQMIKPVALLMVDAPKFQTTDISFPVLILSSDLKGTYKQFEVIM